MQFLAKRIDLLGPLAQRKVKDLTNVIKSVKSVKLNDLALTAFKSLGEFNVTALAVVDNNGIIIENFTTSCLKVNLFSGSLFLTFKAS